MKKRRIIRVGDMVQILSGGIGTIEQRGSYSYWPGNDCLKIKFPDGDVGWYHEDKMEHVHSPKRITWRLKCKSAITTRGRHTD